MGLEVLGRGYRPCLPDDWATRMRKSVEDVKHRGNTEVGV